MKLKFLGLIFLLLINCQILRKQNNSSDTVSNLNGSSVSNSVTQKEETETILEEGKITEFGKIQKALVSKKDSVFWVNENIRSDYQIFGYEQADTNKFSQAYSIFSFH